MSLPRKEIEELDPIKEMSKDWKLADWERYLKTMDLAEDYNLTYVGEVIDEFIDEETPTIEESIDNMGEKEFAKLVFSYADPKVYPKIHKSLPMFIIHLIYSIFCRGF